MPLTYMYITNSSTVAKIAEANGVKRIFIDMETLGKEERQKNMNSVKSSHTYKDIENVKSALSISELLVRVNPLNEKSQEEIDRAISCGADLIMLPMFRTCEEIRKLVAIVNGRAKVVPLVETVAAEQSIDEIVKVKGIDEIHIGLNDLHLDYKKKFMFELLTDGTVERLASVLRKSSIPFGFGGIAKLNEGMLPARMILAEHYRLGSTRAILSRSFCNTELVQDTREIDLLFKEGMKEIRAYEELLCTKSDSFFCDNQREICRRVDSIVNN